MTVSELQNIKWSKLVDLKTASAIYALIVDWNEAVSSLEGIQDNSSDPAAVTCARDTLAKLKLEP